MTFELKYCGICHTDVHIADNDMGRTHYPCVPGHELAGVVTTVGSNVTNYKVRRMVVHIVLLTGSWKTMSQTGPQPIVIELVCLILLL